MAATEIYAPSLCADPLIRSERATIYRQGGMGMGYVRQYVRDLSASLRPWAQYPKAMQLRYTLKGARNPRGTIVTPQSSGAGWWPLLIADGWDLFEPADGMTRPRREQCGAVAVTTSRSRFASFDPAWTAEFWGGWDSHAAKTRPRVLFDSRTPPDAFRL